MGLLYDLSVPAVILVSLALQLGSVPVLLSMRKTSS
jgi:hypothetical protein